MLSFRNAKTVDVYVNRRISENRALYVNRRVSENRAYIGLNIIIITMVTENKTLLRQ